MKEARCKRPRFVWFYLCEMSRKSKSLETVSILVIPTLGLELETGSDCSGHQVSFGGNGNLLKLEHGNVCTTLSVKKIFMVHIWYFNNFFKVVSLVNNYSYYISYLKSEIDTHAKHRMTYIYRPPLCFPIHHTFSQLFGKYWVSVIIANWN